MTQVEALAKYAARASFADLSAQSRQQLPVHILDSLGCCIAALGAGPVEACRAQVADFGGNGPCALISGGNANPIFAAFWHTALVRYVDFMDNFLAPTETCHTADNFGVALTIADYVGGSGRDLMLAVALAYTVQSRFVDHANFMTRGFDHTAQLAFSLNAAAGKLLGLSEPQIADAIAMAAVSDASFAVVRAKPLSQWKGLASAQSALGAMNTLFLARRGVEGPLQVIEGPNGIDNLLHMQIHIDWDKQGYEGVLESTIKKYNSMIHTQSAVHCMVELVRQNKLDPGKVVSIEANVIRIAYDFAGGGLYGVDKVVRTKEQADHSLPYRRNSSQTASCAPMCSSSSRRFRSGRIRNSPTNILRRCLPRLSSGYRTVRSSNTRFRIFQGSPPVPSRGRSPSKSSTDSRPVTPTKGRAARSKMPCILSKTFKLRI